MDFVRAFIVGGAICVVGQVLLDRTKLTYARISVLFVVVGCILGGLGLYEKLVEFAGAGATVPLTGFGNALAKGVKAEVDKMGLIGVMTGGMKAASVGLTSVILAGVLASLVFNPKPK